MKVLCINNNPYYHSMLTIGKWYEVDAVVGESYKLLCDVNWYDYIHKSYFITEKENRKLKLDKINDSRRNL